jgi:putative FmdB family regulatory protein
MPIYEYRCAACHTLFEKLRPMSQADAPIPCARCGDTQTSRAISVFAAISKSKSGESHAVRGTGGGCASCGASSCANCSH